MSARTKVVFTVEDIKDHHFRTDADCADDRGRIEKVWDPSCPYCGSRLFKRWWRHEVAIADEKPPEKPSKKRTKKPIKH